jgi:hypothetical protein
MFYNFIFYKFLKDLLVFHKNKIEYYYLYNFVSINNNKTILIVFKCQIFVFV